MVGREREVCDAGFTKRADFRFSGGYAIFRGCDLVERLRGMDPKSEILEILRGSGADEGDEMCLVRCDTDTIPFRKS